MISDTLLAAAVTLCGLVVLAASVLVIAFKGSKGQAVKWKGLGITIEIKPCNDCHLKG